MATQMQMIGALIDKIEQQAEKTALLKQDVDMYQRLAHRYEERALKAEAENNEEYNGMVVHTNMLVREKHELQERLEQGEEHIRFLLSCVESGESLTHEDYARIGRWQRGDIQPDPYAGLVEYKEEVSVNGK